jgi:hypothetical protein
MRSRVHGISLAIVVALAALAPPARAQLPPATPRSDPLTERERAIHLLSRATGDFPALVMQGFGVLVGSADFQRY